MLIEYLTKLKVNKIIPRLNKILPNNKPFDGPLKLMNGIIYAHKKARIDPRNVHFHLNR